MDDDIRTILDMLEDMAYDKFTEYNGLNRDMNHDEEVAWNFEDEDDKIAAYRRLRAIYPRTSDTF